MSWRDSEREPRRVGDSLNRVVPGGTAFTTLLQQWADVAGANLASHTRPTALHATTLVVAVEDPAWATQLRYLEGDLVSRCADLLGRGLVTEIRVVVRPG
jgi:hypothetical protein